MAVYKSLKRANIESEVFDVIVIGSGASGLTCAAILAKLHDRKVLVLEQHDRPGGCLHTFTEKGVVFRTGMHYIGELGDEITDVYEYITNGNAPTTPTKADGKYEIVERYLDFKNGRTVVLYRGRYNYEKTIGVKPEVVENMANRLRFYVLFKILPECIAYLLWIIFWILYTDTTDTYDDFMARNCTAKRKKIKAWRVQQGDVGLSTRDIPAVIGAAVSRHYILGTIQIPDNFIREICKTIKRSKGKVVVGAPVVEIILKANKAIGVKLKSGISIWANTIVSACGAANTTEMVPKTKLPQLRKVCKDLGASVSHLSVFVAVQGNRLTHRIPQANTWIRTKKNKMIFIRAVEQGDKLAIHILAEDFEIKHLPKLKQNYDNYKQFKKERLIQLLFDVYPSTQNSIIYSSAGTAKTTKTYLGSKYGESYGLSSEKRRYNHWETVRTLRPDTSIQGLYLTGQDTLCIGVCSAIATGLITARQIEGYSILNAITKSDMLDRIHNLSI